MPLAASRAEGCTYVDSSGRIAGGRGWTPRQVSTVVLGGAAAFAVLGLVQQTGVLPIRGFHPKGENNAFALWSGVLLLAAAATAWRLGMRAEQARRRFATFGVALAALSVDEVFTVHERLEEALGIDWQLLYAPVAVLGGGLFVSLLPAFRATGGLPLVLLAPPMWFVAQTFEFLQWNDDTMLHPWMVYPEEVLEMMGSSMLLLGLYASLHLVGLTGARRGHTRASPPLAGATARLRQPRARTSGHVSVRRPVADAPRRGWTDVLGPVASRVWTRPPTARNP